MDGLFHGKSETWMTGYPKSSGLSSLSPFFHGHLMILMVPVFIHQAKPFLGTMINTTMR